MKNLYKLLIGAILFISIFYVWRTCSQDTYTEESSETTMSVDTTSIDSLQASIEFWRAIQPQKRDTVVDTVVIEKPVQVDDSTNRYTNFYSDSTLDATITSEVTTQYRNNSYEGILQNQVFTYSIKRQRVQKKETVVTVSSVKTITNTRTLRKDPKPYFTVGAEIGRHVFGPTVGFANPQQYHIFYRYDIQNEGHSLGFSIPITF